MRIIISVSDGNDGCSIIYSDKTKPPVVGEGWGKPPISDEALQEALDKIREALKR